MLARLLLALAVSAAPAIAGGDAGDSGDGGCGAVMPFGDLLELDASDPDAVASYGSDDLQHGELRLPPGPGPHPVAIVVHGGCWLSQSGLDHVRPLATALAEAGVATWTPEYRRLGDDGGGWPGTFLDVAHAADHLRTLARHHPLDLDWVVAVGHSAGGHLALWLASRPTLSTDSEVATGDPLPLLAVVSLAGIPDLSEAIAEQICGDAAARLLGGNDPEVLRAASPAERLPLGVPQELVAGACDPIVPPAVGRRYAAAAAAAGDDITLRVVDGVGHFELVAPGSPAWPAVLDAVTRALGGGAPPVVRVVPSASAPL